MQSKRAPLSKFSLPNIVDELPYSIQVVDTTLCTDLDTSTVLSQPKTIQFNELRIKREHTFFQHYQKEHAILYQDLIQNAGQSHNEFHDGCKKEDLARRVSDSKVFALGVESQPTSDSKYKYINRVVLVNERGDRVLDTLVKPTKLPEGCKIMARDGLKTKIFELATDVGPSLETVAEVVANIVKDKPFVGYLQMMKLTDILYWDAAITIGGKVSRESYDDYRSTENKVIGQIRRDEKESTNIGHNNRFKPKDVETSENSLFANLYDTSKIFNKTAHNQVQFNFSKLCKDELNICIPHRTYPFAFSEAKISMALYFKWLDIKSGRAKHNPSQIVQPIFANHQTQQPQKMSTIIPNFDQNKFTAADTKDYRKYFESFKIEFHTNANQNPIRALDLTQGFDLLSVLIKKHVDNCVRKEIRTTLMNGLSSK